MTSRSNWWNLFKPIYRNCTELGTAQPYSEYQDCTTISKKDFVGLFSHTQIEKFNSTLIVIHELIENDLCII